MFAKTSSIVAMTVAALGISAANASAADPHHIDDLAFAVRNDAARIANEVRYHFRHSPHFEHLYSDAYEMYQLADHIHDIAHEHGDLEHIRADMTELDELFHHLEELVDEATVGGIHGGHYSSWHRRSHGYHGARLKRLVARLSENLHHLQEDVDAVLGPVVIPQQPVIPAPPVFNAPKTGKKIQFNRGGFGITLRLN